MSVKTTIAVGCMFLFALALIIYLSYLALSGDSGSGSKAGSKSGSGPTPAQAPSPSGGSDSGSPVAPDFIIHETGDRIFGDLSYTPNQTLDQCKALCKANNDCIGISHSETNKHCYQKGTTGGGGEGEGHGPLQIQYVPSDIQFYYKNVPGYSVKGAGDRVRGDIQGMPVTKETLKDCADVCTSKQNCVGFSYNSHDNMCYAKKEEGLDPNYQSNEYQYYSKVV